MENPPVSKLISKYTTNNESELRGRYLAWEAEPFPEDMSY